MEIIKVNFNDKITINEIKRYSNSVCREEIDIPWIDKCLRKFHYCYICVNKNKIKGLITFTKDKRTIEVTLLCSNYKEGGLGRKLINIAIIFAKDNNLECELNSVPNSVDFYLRCGFLNVGDIEKINLTPMYYPMTDLNNKITKTIINEKDAYAHYIEECYNNKTEPVVFRNFVKSLI